MRFRGGIHRVRHLSDQPGLLHFVEGIIGPGWKNSTRWVTRAVTVFAVAAIVIDLALARPGASVVANSWLVLTLISIALAHAFYGSTTAVPRPS